jgi:two-component system NarL family sensor kinase
MANCPERLLKSKYLLRFIVVILFAISSTQCAAISYSDSVLNSTKNLPDSAKVAKILQAANAIRNKDFSNCISLCDAVINIESKKNNSNTLGEAYLLKGLTSYFAGEYEQTLDFYLTAIKNFEQGKNLEGKAKVLNELGIFYRKQQNDTSSLKSFKEAYELASSIQNKGIMATSINNQGLLAQDFGKHNDAIELFKQAEEIYQQINDSIGISYTMDYASVSYAAQGNFDLAKQNETTSLQLRMQLKDSNAASLSLINLAEFEKLQGNTDKSINYLFQCIAISEKIKYKDLTSYCYKVLSEQFAKKNDNQKAYFYHVKYAELNEEIFNETRSKQINELQTKYETEKRIQQIELLTKENELKEIRNRNQLLFLLGLMIISGIVGFAIYQNQKRKKQHEIDQLIIQEKETRSKAIIEAEEKERIRIARDLHDGIAQTMTAAKMQLESFIEKSDKTFLEHTNIQTIFDLIKDAGQEVRAVSHSMIPNALLKSGLVAAVRDFVNRTSTEKLKINLVVLGLNERIHENIETVVFRVLQELINNILKHANANEVTIQLIREASELTMMVEDNGIGFETSILSNPGIGLKNIRSRIEYLNGTFDIDSSVGNGTTVIIEIPLV